MPLHLLGKKSWNVYNQANIDRVRRDEAAAQAKEEAEEARTQQEDAARRMAILRGEQPPSPGPSPTQTLSEAERAVLELSRGSGRDEPAHVQRERKRRRIRGEDDTDRDIRFAREDAEASMQSVESSGRLKLSGTSSDAPVEDDRGHIQLFSESNPQKAKDSNSDRQTPAIEARKAHGQAGFPVVSDFKSAKEKPWYAAEGTANKPLTISDKDIWGNEDPRRREREQNRLVSSDPFAMMQKAQRQLKASERDKDAWEKDRQRELQDLKKDDRRRQRQKRRHLDEDDALEEWDLDGKANPVMERARDRDHDRDRSRGSRHRHRSDDVDRDRQRRHRHHHRHKHRE